MAVTGAALLNEARTRAGLSRRVLAAKAGVPTSTVSRIEEGHSDPTLTMLERLLAAAGSNLVLAAHPRDDHSTLAELANAVNASEGRIKIDWTRLRGFADWAGQHRDELADAIAHPPVRTNTPLDAILAAFAEQLAGESGLASPPWTRSVGALREPWSPPGTPRMRTLAEAATTEPFRRRRLTLARSALFRSAA